MKTVLIVALVAFTSGCVTTTDGEQSSEPHFTIFHSTGGWGYTREWRIYNDRLSVGRWRSGKFIVEHAKGITVAEFRRLADVWARLDARLWTHSVHFTDILFLSDGPTFGLRGPGEERSFAVDAPIAEMMPAVEAIAELLPARHRPRFAPISSPYEWRVRIKEEPNRASAFRKTGVRLAACG